MAAARATLGVGAILIFAAKFLSVVSGYVIVAALQRALGTAYGDYATVTEAANILNMVMITGTIQAVAKCASETPDRAGAIFRAALRLQLALGLAAAMLFAAAAPAFAAYQRGTALTGYCWLAAAVIFCYALYAVAIGICNGLKRFQTQALFDIHYSLLRIACIVGAAMLGWGVWGALGGFAAASAVILAVALPLTRPPAQQERYPLRNLLRYAVPIMLYTFVFNLFMKTEFFMLRGSMTDEAAAQAVAAVYGGVLKIASIPYLAIISVSFIVFPLLSEATHLGDQERARTYIRESSRFSLILAVWIAAVIAGNPEQSLLLLFDARMLPGASALPFLTAGYGALALAAIASTLLISGGYPRLVTALVIGGWLADVLLCQALIPAGSGMGTPEHARMAAIAAALAMGAWLAACGYCTQKKFGAFIDWRCLVRVLVAGVFVYWLSQGGFMESSRALTVVKFAGLSAAFFGALWLSREIGAADIGKLRGMLKRS